MKTLLLILSLLLVADHAAADDPASLRQTAIPQNLLHVADHAVADDRLEFKLTVSPVEWNLAKDSNNKMPVLILWCIKNKSDQQIVLPLGTPSFYELVDDKNKRVMNGAGSGAAITLITRNDYYNIAPKFSIYTLGGLTASLTTVKNQLFLDIGDMIGNGAHLGPLVPGKYRFRCIFSTRLDPTDYAKMLINDKSSVWLGEFTSDWVEITVK